MKQMKFEFDKNHSKQFGGDLLKGRRKSARPIAVKSPMHFVLKSDKARGKFSFVNHQRSLERFILRISKRFNVKACDFAINYNHIHFVIRINDRRLYNKWIRALTSGIVQILSVRTNTKLSHFFTLRPFSVIIAWGRQFRSVLEYVIKNKMEVFGIFRKLESFAYKKEKDF